MPLHKPMLSLSLDDEEDEDEDEVDAGPSTASHTEAGSSERPSPYVKQGSFNLSATNTFEAADIRLRGTRGMERADGQSEVSSIMLNDLEQQKKLGAGASGTVYLVKHRTTGDQYALKQLTAMANENTRRQAVNELQIAQKHASHSDHLVRFIDAYFHNGAIHVLMEFCDGGSLEDLLAEKVAERAPNFPLGAITLQILNGLTYMHREMKQVHRDLKPGNVMLTSSGGVKLSDFGISKQLEDTMALAMTQVGTTQYMAPERMKGDSYSWPADVWAVGIIVLEALLGEHPFPTTRHKTFVALMMAISQGSYPPPPDGTPPEIAAFVESSLRLDADARASVQELTRCEWLKPISHPRKPVFKWLMARAAKAASA